MTGQSVYLISMQEKKWRTDYPGACTIEYESVMQIVIAVLIG